MITAVYIIWGVCVVLFMTAFTIGIAIMTGRELKLGIRRNCREEAQEAMKNGDLEQAEKYIEESKKYRLTRGRNE